MLVDFDGLGYGGRRGHGLGRSGGNVLRSSGSVVIVGQNDGH